MRLATLLPLLIRPCRVTRQDLPEACGIIGGVCAVVSIGLAMWIIWLNR